MGKTTMIPFSLTQGWNKLQIDLTAVGKEIDLKNIAGMKFSFRRIGDTKLFLDDLILIDYQKMMTNKQDRKSAETNSISAPPWQPDWNHNDL